MTPNRWFHVLTLLACIGCARSSPSLVPGGDVSRGRAALATNGCGSCHEIAGVPGADGLVGPPLTTIASRSIIAGELANTPENMERWILDPPAVEPGTVMPNMHLTERDARDMVAYLYTLR
jgi:cytochrome c1